MSFIGNKLIYEKNQRFPSSVYPNKNVIEKVDQFSYWVEDYLMFAFKEDELREFMKWYLENQRDSFLLDFLCHDGGVACHKYFKLKDVNYDKELFTHFDEWVKDIDHFIDFCVGQYKKFCIYKRKDHFFKFSTKNGYQIMRNHALEEAMKNPLYRDMYIKDS